MVRRALTSALRRRIVVTYAFLALVVCIGALTALIALQSASQRSAQVRAADAQLAELDELHALTDELARTARRYLLSGNSNVQLRAHALAGSVGRLATQAGYREGTTLRRELEGYVATMLSVMELDTAAPVERLDRFEQELERARAVLDDHFESAAAVARARRNATPSVATLATRAQWAVISATVIALVLAGVACASTLQAVRSAAHGTNAGDRDAATDAGARSPRESFRREPCDVAALVDRATRDRRDLAFERSVRLRYEAALAKQVMVDRLQLRHTFGSLLELAILETRPGGCITLHVAETDGGVRFAIISDAPDAMGENTSEVVVEQCRRVIGAHGGKLDVQTGAAMRTYWFTIPSGPVMLT